MPPPAIVDVPALMVVAPKMPKASSGPLLTKEKPLMATAPAPLSVFWPAEIVPPAK